ncbi:MAG: hypothetical protein B6D68_02355 [spirochete symbiont of Stewartia floridana]|nr:MAG: hypothetical protein B6D68_02355 [spirochete symbiont of Stewartia floridana]
MGMNLPPFRIQTAGIVGCLKENGKGCLFMLLIQDYTLVKCHISNLRAKKKKEGSPLVPYGKKRVRTYA